VHEVFSRVVASVAAKGDRSGPLWRVMTPAANISGVAVANGVVYL
jgi:hypothetical protein